MIVQNMYPLYTLYSDPIPVTMHYFHSIFTYNPVVEIQTHPWMKMPTLSPTSRDGRQARLPLKTSKEQNTQELSKECLATKKLQKQMWIRSSTILPRCSKPSPSPAPKAAPVPPHKAHHHHYHSRLLLPFSIWIYSRLKDLYSI